MGVKAVGGSWLIWVTRRGERGRRVRNFTPRWLSSPSTGWVVTLESRISRCGSAPETAFQWSQNASTSRAWVALGDVGACVDEVVGAGVLGEEGQHAAGALGAAGDVVAFQRRVVAP